MTMEKYILNKHGQPIIEPDPIKWAQWFENFDNRIVAKAEIGEVCVSTVFLGLDYNLNWNKDDPVIWETMVFGGKLDQEQDRCGGSREQAEAMHERMVKKIQELENENAKS